MDPSKFTIPFNQPYFTGDEPKFLQEVFAQGKLSGNGPFTQRCQQFLEQKVGGTSLLTTSGTAALEMMALLLEICPGDEVVLPSYTFVSTASAFALRGAKLVFVDVRRDFPVMDEQQVTTAISPRTKVIIAVHYAGVACNMDLLGEIANRYGIALLEDAAQGIGAAYKKKALGSIGRMAAVSFHETKNISAGEGGCLVINDASLKGKAEMIWDKGTDRAAFFRGELAKYHWQELGSSFLPSEVTAALLWAQCLAFGEIIEKRKRAWAIYDQYLPSEEELYRKPVIPDEMEHNGHGYFLVFRDEALQIAARRYLNENGVLALTHYEPLHLSPFYLKNNPQIHLPETEKVAKTLLRLPLYNSITLEQQMMVISLLERWKASVQVKDSRIVPEK